MAANRQCRKNTVGEFMPKFAELNDDVLLVKCGAEKNNFPYARTVPL